MLSCARLVLVEQQQQQRQSRMAAAALHGLGSRAASQAAAATTPPSSQHATTPTTTTSHTLNHATTMTATEASGGQNGTSGTTSEAADARGQASTSQEDQQPPKARSKSKSQPSSIAAKSRGNVQNPQVLLGKVAAVPTGRLSAERLLALKLFAKARSHVGVKWRNPTAAQLGIPGRRTVLDRDGRAAAPRKLAFNTLPTFSQEGAKQAAALADTNLARSHLAVVKHVVRARRYAKAQARAAERNAREQASKSAIPSSGETQPSAASSIAPLASDTPVAKASNDSKAATTSAVETDSSTEARKLAKQQQQHQQQSAAPRKNKSRAPRIPHNSPSWTAVHMATVAAEAEERLHFARTLQVPALPTKSAPANPRAMNANSLTYPFPFTLKQVPVRPHSANPTAPHGVSPPSAHRRITHDVQAMMHQLNIMPGWWKPAASNAKKGVLAIQTARERRLATRAQTALSKRQFIGKLIALAHEFGQNATTGSTAATPIIGKKSAANNKESAANDKESAANNKETSKQSAPKEAPEQPEQFNPLPLVDLPSQPAGSLTFAQARPAFKYLHRNHLFALERAQRRELVLKTKPQQSVTAPSQSAAAEKMAAQLASAVKQLSSPLAQRTLSADLRWDQASARDLLADLSLPMPHDPLTTPIWSLATSDSSNVPPPTSDALLLAVSTLLNSQAHATGLTLPAEARSTAQGSQLSVPASSTEAEAVPASPISQDVPALTRMVQDLDASLGFSPAKPFAADSNGRIVQDLNQPNTTRYDREVNAFARLYSAMTRAQIQALASNEFSEFFASTTSAVSDELAAKTTSKLLQVVSEGLQDALVPEDAIMVLERRTLYYFLGRDRAYALLAEVFVENGRADFMVSHILKHFLPSIPSQFRISSSQTCTTLVQKLCDAGDLKSAVSVYEALVARQLNSISRRLVRPITTAYAALGQLESAKQFLATSAFADNRSTNHASIVPLVLLAPRSPLASFTVKEARDAIDWTLRMMTQAQQAHLAFGRMQLLRSALQACGEAGRKCEQTLFGTVHASATERDAAIAAACAFLTSAASQWSPNSAPASAAFSATAATAVIKLANHTSSSRPPNRVSVDLATHLIAAAPTSTDLMKVVCHIVASGCTFSDQVFAHLVASAQRLRCLRLPALVIAAHVQQGRSVPTTAASHLITLLGLHTDDATAVQAIKDLATVLHQADYQLSASAYGAILKAAARDVEPESHLRNVWRQLNGAAHHEHVRSHGLQALLVAAGQSTSLQAEFRHCFDVVTRRFGPDGTYLHRHRQRTLANPGFAKTLFGVEHDAFLKPSWRVASALVSGASHQPDQLDMAVRAYRHLMQTKWVFGAEGFDLNTAQPMLMGCTLTASGLPSIPLARRTTTSRRWISASLARTIQLERGSLMPQSALSSSLPASFVIRAYTSLVQMVNSATSAHAASNAVLAIAFAIQADLPVAPLSQFYEVQNPACSLQVALFGLLQRLQAHRGRSPAPRSQNALIREMNAIARARRYLASLRASAWHAPSQPFLLLLATVLRSAIDQSRMSPVPVMSRLLPVARRTPSTPRPASQSATV
ncbi:hypothetical protein CAOG_02142 [Capsaspora owczarzaki ATCC 30864]|uniref:Uncharacterized protein n=1 Tax=Capsaspora owczarzaki (strain ATCC 30864) TaxID=595528 RepID=A0A0D2X1J3_CAPO3|nr:hypothetical protein CAOG_02142 [Capsaspora owczarzaki ATCC 30864]KJE90909.1 hypothetical protein CAOG_002142 [Capsaspora owczarzaki ATCC 30864]|eukprot:XP_004348892.2 hypothetical protein CAOG_02142 [Capsaspora owczarzaki ATCC 30864]